MRHRRDGCAQARCLAIAAGMAALLAAAPAGAGVYRWVDDQGRTHYGDRPPAERGASRVEVRPNTYQSRPIPKRPTDDQGQDEAAAGPDVVIYTTDWCPVCRKAKAYFRANAIPFTEYDIEKDARARREYDRRGGDGVPLIVVGDRQRQGFSPGGFQRFYRAAR